jgi:hypothetical protein
MRAAKQSRSCGSTLHLSNMYRLFQDRYDRGAQLCKPHIERRKIQAGKSRPLLMGKLGYAGFSVTGSDHHSSYVQRYNRP